MWDGKGENPLVTSAREISLFKDPAQGGDVTQQEARTQPVQQVTPDNEVIGVQAGAPQVQTEDQIPSGAQVNDFDMVMRMFAPPRR